MKIRKIHESSEFFKVSNAYIHADETHSKQKIIFKNKFKRIHCLLACGNCFIVSIWACHGEDRGSIPCKRLEIQKAGGLERVHAAFQNVKLAVKF